MTVRIAGIDTFSRVLMFTVDHLSNAGARGPVEKVSKPAAPLQSRIVGFGQSAGAIHGCHMRIHAKCHVGISVIAVAVHLQGLAVQAAIQRVATRKEPPLIVPIRPGVKICYTVAVAISSARRAKPICTRCLDDRELIGEARNPHETMAVGIRRLQGSGASHRKIAQRLDILLVTTGLVPVTVIGK